MSVNCLAHAWNAGQQVTYWREEPLEVDGVLDGDWGRWALEVKTGAVRRSDLKGVLEFTRRHPAYRPLLICAAGQHMAAREHRRRVAIAWRRFLLGRTGSGAITTRVSKLRRRPEWPRSYRSKRAAMREPLRLQNLAHLAARHDPQSTQPRPPHESRTPRCGAVSALGRWDRQPRRTTPGPRRGCLSQPRPFGPGSRCPTRDTGRRTWSSSRSMMAVSCRMDFIPR